MAKVWVYNWNHVRSGEGAQWGHSSFQVEGGVYISWWPQSEDRKYMADKTKSPFLAKIVSGIYGTSNVYKVQHRCNPSYQADVNAEKGKSADTVVEIADGVLDTKAITRWWRGYEYEKASYHVIKKNCSTTVIRALRAGGSDKHISITKLGLKGRGPRLDFLSKHSGWEPTDVVTYLKLMNKSLGDQKVNMQGVPVRVMPVEGSGVEFCEHGVPMMTCVDC
jgi:hypothetical protein